MYVKNKMRFSSICSGFHMRSGVSDILKFKSNALVYDFVGTIF